ncbi:alpha/beta fold hydrolase [Nocardia altamirensis]|uniref:alpha/beta fold hydrolase n=1 Tax=Nocardia altamirensis TaxID=472158 RepID=UPI001C3F652F|nr:alpha/beta fold hydrolase [Nocardia altamirensis]
MIGLGVVVAVAAALAVHTVVVSQQTAAAAGERIVQLPDGDVHVVEDGPAGAPALLLIHGYASSVDWWDSIVPALAEHYRVIRLDLLGHGSSAKPTAGYDMPSQARRAAAVLDKLGVTKAAVIGHSMGGLVATSLAEQRPDLVTALTLIDSPPNPASAIQQSLITRLVAVPVLGELLWQFRTDSRIRAGLSTAFTRDIAVPDAIVAGVRGMTYRSFTESPKESRRYTGERSLPDRLASIGRPVLVIFGSEDGRVRSASAEDYRIIPGVRIEMLPGVGHTPMLEDPQRTTDLILSFAAETAPK